MQVDTCQFKVGSQNILTEYILTANYEQTSVYLHF